MKITKLKVCNFKSFENEEFTFNPKINMNYIYGANGIGKSTLINISKFINDLIQKELRIFDYNNLPAMFRQQHYINKWNDIYNEYVTIGSEDSIKVEIEFVENYDSKEKYRYFIELIKGDIFINEKYSIIKGDEEKIIFNKKLNEEFSLDYLDEEIKFLLSDLKKNNSNSILSFINREKITKSKINELIESKKGNVITKLLRLFAFPGEIYPVNVEQMLTEGVVIIPKLNAFTDPLNTHLDQAKAHVNKWKEFIKGFESFAMSIDKNILGVEFKYKSDDPNNHIIWYEFAKKTTGGKKIFVPFSKESQGTKTYLNHYFNIVAINEDKNAVILIDEFGQNLHEELIIKLANYISNVAVKNDKQVILVTHSAIIMNENYVKSVIEKDWNKERLIMNRMPSGKLILTNLAGENKRENNHTKFLRGLYGGAPDISEIMTDYD